MGRPRKLDVLTTTVSGRIRTEQAEWLRRQADRQFDGELSRTLRWALDQAEFLSWILSQAKPAQALDEALHPEMYGPQNPEVEVAEAERELEEWKHQQAIKRARKKADG